MQSFSDRWNKCGVMALPQTPTVSIKSSITVKAEGETDGREEKNQINPLIPFHLDQNFTASH